jgi:hypothetical protein
MPHGHHGPGLPSITKVEYREQCPKGASHTSPEQRSGNRAEITHAF